MVQVTREMRGDESSCRLSACRSGVDLPGVNAVTGAALVLDGPALACADLRRVMLLGTRWVVPNSIVTNWER
jgi:hypothetical protein